LNDLASEEEGHGQPQPRQNVASRSGPVPRAERSEGGQVVPSETRRTDGANRGEARRTREEVTREAVASHAGFFSEVFSAGFPSPAFFSPGFAFSGNFPSASFFSAACLASNGSAAGTSKLNSAPWGPTLAESLVRPRSEYSRGNCSLAVIMPAGCIWAIRT